MREIKFRVWDSNDECMSLCDSLNAVDMEWLGWTVFRGLDHYVVMQYTGLKDKNGKEIYDGDILGSFSLKEKMLQAFTRIKWVEVYYFENQIAMQSGFWVRHGYVWDYSIDILLSYNFEVIGNIYENPELLIK